MVNFVRNSVAFQLENFRVPDAYENVCWEDLVDIVFEDRAIAKQYVEDFPENQKTCLYVSHKTSGTGKTSFAICLAHDLIRSGKLKSYSLFFSYIELMDALRQDRISFADSPIYQKIKGVDFIVFDDIGVMRLNESVAERYYLILDLLWSQKIHAIFTSKFTINELLKRANDNVDKELMTSIGSRLEGICLEVALKNQRDFRVK